MNNTLQMKGEPMEISYDNNYYAIIIGIDNYNNSEMSTLSSAKKDARDLYKFLTETGGYKKENTVLLVDENAEKGKIYKQIENLNHRYGKDSTLMFYFSGHGSNVNSNFILPLYNYDENNPNTYFCGDELVDLFSNIQVDKLLFLFDTCYAGILTKGSSMQSKEASNDFLDKLMETPIYNSRVLVASSLPNQTSFEIKDRYIKIENGIFTHCLLKALKGACQTEKNSSIYILDLLRYLIKNVSMVASQQDLMQNCCIKTSVLYQDFPICHTSGEVDYLTQLPKRYINAVVDLEEDSNTLLEQFAEGLSKRNVDSKFTYWGQEVTKKYIELLNTKEYNLPEMTQGLISNNIAKIIEKMEIGSKGIRIISLGIGDGHKDAIILNKICEMLNTPIDYWIIEFSFEMLKTGLKNVQDDLGEKNNQRISTKLFQTDFLDIGILSDLITDDKINLFLLLGNTLGNFPEDTLLNKIYSVMRYGDFFLIDNQIKNERKLTSREKQNLNEMYNTKKYKDYIYSILKNAKIDKTHGKIKTRITDYKDASNAILREYNCATVTQEFIFDKTVEVEVGGKKLSFNKDTIIPVIYSRKYTKGALSALLDNYFTIIESYYTSNKYALILSKK